MRTHSTRLRFSSCKYVNLGMTGFLRASWMSDDIQLARGSPFYVGQHRGSKSTVKQNANQTGIKRKLIGGKRMKPIKLTKVVLTLALMLTACTPVQGEVPSITTPTSAAVEDEDSLANTQWALTSFGAPGAETAAMEEVPITLEFTGEGQLAGNGGCNSYSGEYQLEGETLTVGEIVSTLVACVDTEAMEQEISYFEALQLATTYALVNDSLTIFYASDETGAGQLNFARAADSESTEPAPAEETPASESETPTPAPEANSGSTPESSEAIVVSVLEAWNFEDAYNN